MRRFRSLFAQDSTLIWRNGHVAVAAAFAALMIALILFLPEEVSTGPTQFVLDSLPDAPVSSSLTTMGAEQRILPSSQSEFASLLESNPRAIGVEISGSASQPQVTITQQTVTSPEAINVLQASLDTVLRSVSGEPVQPLPVNLIRPRVDPVPLNLTGIPVFLAFEVGILGFLLVAVFVFQEKQEGTIRAYRVTPGGLWPYLASKAAVFTVLSLLYGFVVVVVGVGLNANWPAILALIVWASLLMTILGLGFAVWFENLSDWFFPGLLILIINMLPFFSYVYPVFTPSWMPIIPSYGLVFSLREALFPTGNQELITRTLFTGVAWLGGVTLFATLSIRARLLKGA